MSTLLSSLKLPFYTGEDRDGMMGVCSSGEVGMQTHMAFSPNPMFLLFPLTSQIIVSSPPNHYSFSTFTVLGA